MIDISKEPVLSIDEVVNIYGDQETAILMIGSYASTALQPDGFTALYKAMKSQTWDVYAREAHSIKGAAKYFLQSTSNS